MFIVGHILEELNGNKNMKLILFSVLKSCVIYWAIVIYDYVGGLFANVIIKNIVGPEEEKRVDFYVALRLKLHMLIVVFLYFWGQFLLLFSLLQRIKMIRVDVILISMILAGAMTWLSYVLTEKKIDRAIGTMINSILNISLIFICPLLLGRG